ncbi:MAG: GlsB/YeaQ/YmgE family stress response membrane protein [Planctomycetes bacterium]|nr:GlsB/YeaQ/YmgE family stress response membrane protein [Planctomycetota bacterium]
MEPFELPSQLQHILSDVLIWIGFGTVVGLVAKAIMPGRDPGGAIATLMMGIGGSVIGSGLLSYCWNGHRVTPISPIGFVVATAGAFVLLFFYRLLSGRFQLEAGDNVRGTEPYYRRYGRRRADYARRYDD